MLWKLKAYASYWLARRLFHWSWFVRQPRGWHWLEGQFAAHGQLGYVVGPNFLWAYPGPFAAKGLARGKRACACCAWRATAGDGKAAYQSGALSLAAAWARPQTRPSGTLVDHCRPGRASVGADTPASSSD